MSLRLEDLSSISLGDLVEAVVRDGDFDWDLEYIFHTVRGIVVYKCIGGVDIELDKELQLNVPYSKNVPTSKELRAKHGYNDDTTTFKHVFVRPRQIKHHVPKSILAKVTGEFNPRKITLTYLQRFFSSLSLHRINAVKTKFDDVESLVTIAYDAEGNYQCKTVDRRNNMSTDRMREIYEGDKYKVGKNLYVYYKNYFGFANNIYFGIKGFHNIDYETLTWNTNSVNRDAPQPGDLIIGEITEGKQGKYFKHWFIPSPEFLYFYRLILGMERGQINHDRLKRSMDGMYIVDQVEMALPEEKVRIVKEANDSLDASYCDVARYGCTYKSLVNYLLENGEPSIQTDKLVKHLTHMWN